VVRVWLLLVSTLGAACGFSPKSAASIDGAMTDGPSDLDSDGDGIPDSLDNCPTIPNQAQNDKDGDGRGDACDLCPHIATVSDPDTDGDGIGDACDPRPTIPGDHLALFDGFYAPSDIAAWVPIPADGNWEELPDHSVQQDSATSGDQVFEYSSAVKKTYSAVSFKLGAISPGGGAGMCSGVLGPQHYCCVLEVDASDSNVKLEATDSSISMPVLWAGSFETDDTVVMVQNLDAMNNHCDATVGSNEQQVDLAIGQATNGNFELYTASTSAAFDYVFAVEIGP
jgi:hypothetical protein